MTARAGVEALDNAVIFLTLDACRDLDLGSRPAAYQRGALDMIEELRRYAQRRREAIEGRP